METRRVMPLVTDLSHSSWEEDVYTVVITGLAFTRGYWTACIFILGIWMRILMRSD